MNRENFNLSKFKIDTQGRLEANYEIMHTDGDTAHAEQYTMKSRRITHPDLRQLMDDLRLTVAEANDLLLYRHIKCAPAKQQHLDKLTKELNKLDNELVESITVTGISIQGDVEGTHDKRSVVITAKREIKGKNRDRYTAVAMNTPKIMFSSDIFGFEAALAEDVERIIDEVYLYVVERKSNQAVLEFPEDDAEDQPAAKLLDS